jgi:hypothetical protein
VARTRRVQRPPFSPSVGPYFFGRERSFQTRKIRSQGAVPKYARAPQTANLETITFLRVLHFTATNQPSTVHTISPPTQAALAPAPDSGRLSTRGNGLPLYAVCRLCDERFRNFEASVLEQIPKLMLHIETKWLMIFSTNSWD